MTASGSSTTTRTASRGTDSPGSVPPGMPLVATPPLSAMETSPPVKISTCRARPVSVPSHLEQLHRRGDGFSAALHGPVLVEDHPDPAAEPVEEVARRDHRVDVGAQAVEGADHGRDDLVEPRAPLHGEEVFLVDAGEHLADRHRDVHARHEPAADRGLRPVPRRDRQRERRGAMWRHGAWTRT